MCYMNCCEALLGLLSSLFTADIKSDGAISFGAPFIVGMALRPVRWVVLEQPSWELGTCTMAMELYREGSSPWKLLAENSGACEAEIIAHIGSTWTKSSVENAFPSSFTISTHSKVKTPTGIRWQTLPELFPKALLMGERGTKCKGESLHISHSDIPWLYAPQISILQTQQVSCCFYLSFSKANHKNLCHGNLWWSGEPLLLFSLGQQEREHGITTCFNNVELFQFDEVQCFVLKVQSYNLL